MNKTLVDSFNKLVPKYLRLVSWLFGILFMFLMLKYIEIVGLLQELFS